jgi:hypothetical protein
MASAEQYIKKHIKELSTELTKTLRASAKAKGWDLNIANSVAVSETLEVQIPEDLKEQAFNLEYGFEREPPKPALRNMETKSAVTSAIYEGVSDFFTSAKVIK